MSFFGSLFGGSNPTLNNDIGQFGQISGFATNLGEKNLSTASNFMNAIVSGDSSKINQALAPQISAVKTSAQQQNKTNSIFGNRSGGTAASANATNDKVHSDIVNLIGSLTGSSVSGLASTGGSLLSTGLSAAGSQAQASQQQMENWSNSILGKGITGAASFAESYGLTKLPGVSSSTVKPSDFFNSTTDGYQNM